MVKQVTTYETSDGKKFTSEIEANGHEKFLSINGAVEAFVQASALGPAEATRARKYIGGYVAFVETYSGPMTLPVKAAANDEQPADASQGGEQAAA
jgi:hypothetical protein